MLELLLEDLSPVVLELEIFRCSCCELGAILVPRVMQLFRVWCHLKENVETRGDCVACIVCPNHKQRWKLIPRGRFWLCSSVP